MGARRFAARHSFDCTGLTVVEVAASWVHAARRAPKGGHHLMYNEPLIRLT